MFCIFLHALKITVFSHEWNFYDLSNSVTSTTVCDMSIVLLGTLDVVSQAKSPMVSLFCGRDLNKPFFCPFLLVLGEFRKYIYCFY